MWREWRDRPATPKGALLALRDDSSQPDFQGALARGHVQEQPTRWMGTRPTPSEQSGGGDSATRWDAAGSRGCGGSGGIAWQLHRSRFWHCAMTSASPTSKALWLVATCKSSQHDGW